MLRQLKAGESPHRHPGDQEIRLGEPEMNHKTKNTRRTALVDDANFDCFCPTRIFAEAHESDTQNPTKLYVWAAVEAVAFPVNAV